MPGDTDHSCAARAHHLRGWGRRSSQRTADRQWLADRMQALALAGGPTKPPSSAVRIIRKGPTGMTETRVALKKILEAKAPDVPLQADDILFIPVSGGRVLAVETFERGDVGRDRGLDLQHTSVGAA